ncbi:MAG TPA: type 4a pilus biogenesis protein PilO [Candidatus Ozemobacteraceae bacterium]|nr:type 4a pilus biogenesis protein PilO [Candidatus Ozemobacteraceae bacterium]
MNNFAVVIMIIVFAAAGAGGAFWMYYWEPTMEIRTKLENDIKDLERKKDEIRNVADEIARINESIAKLTEEKKKLEMESNQLGTVVPKLLDSTEAIANKFNVKFQDIRISPLVRAEQWSELPVEVGLLGTFQDIGNFLTIMEKRKIVNLAAGSINISVSAETDTKSKAPLLTVNLSAKVYIMGGAY